MSTYRLCESEETCRPDIVLIDYDDAEALSAGTAARSKFRGAVFLIVTAEDFKGPTLETDHFLLRKRLGAALLGTLDTITRKISFAASTGRPPLAAKRNRRCLVVDDSELVRAQMEMILEKLGLDFELVEDTETALEIVKSASFDLIFLDVMLPEMSGYKACKLLKSDLKTSTTPVVIRTSKKSPFKKMHGAMVGCDSYLTKPVDTVRIHAILRGNRQGLTLAERSGKRMRLTDKATLQLVSAVRQIAEQPVSLADINEQLRGQAALLQQSTYATEQELVGQAKQTQGMFGYLQDLVEAVRVFKLLESTLAQNIGPTVDGGSVEETRSVGAP